MAFCFWNATAGGLSHERQTPRSDHVRLKRIGEEEKTNRGIIVPEAAKEKRQGVLRRSAVARPRTSSSCMKVTFLA